MIQITPKGETPQASPASPLLNVVRQPDKVEGVQGSEPPKEAPAQVDADPISPKLAILAKREKQLRSLQADLKAKEEALKAKEAEYQSGYIPKSRLKEAAMEAYRSGELSYDELTQTLLSQPDHQVDPVVRELKAQNEKLLARLDAIENGAKEKQTQEYQQAVAQLGFDVKSYVAENASDFEAIHSSKMESKVVDLITKTFEEENRIMSIPEACKEIEDYLVEDFVRVSSIGKVKAKLTPQEPVEDKPETKQPNQQQQPVMRTLTNGVTTSPPLSARERAILAFQGKL